MPEPDTAGKPVVYVETSVVSYLTARRSRNAIIAGQQAATRLWWRSRDRFRLVASDIVLREASFGDPVAARKRLRMLKRLALPEFSAEEAGRLAKRLCDPGPLPRNSEDDAAHAAIAALLGADYLCSWNLKHLLNPRHPSPRRATLPRFRLPACYNLHALRFIDCRQRKRRGGVMRNPILRNPILEEVWRAKKHVAAEYGYDVVKLIRSIPQAVKEPSGNAVEPTSKSSGKRRKRAAE